MIFLDVGSHEGQSLEEVVKPHYPFEHIHAFEPMPAQYAILVERFGGLPNVTLHPFGLTGSNEFRVVYGSNEILEASIYPDKYDLDPSYTTVCKFRRASEFIEDLPDGLIVKLNCEGAEVLILDDLIDTGRIWKIRNVMIDFDIRKVPGLEKEEDRILGKLKEVGFDRYRLVHEVMVGATHQDRIAAWLKGVL